MISTMIAMISTMIRRFSLHHLAVLLLTLIASTPLPASGQSLLWKLEGKGLAGASYLYGTIHAICPSDVVIGEDLTTAVSSTARIALELDLDDPRLLVEMGHISFLPRDSTLRNYFRAEDYDFVEAWFKDSVGMSLAPMNNIRPLFLFGLLIGRLLQCKPQSYEEIFMAMAREQGKEVIGLESPAEQMAAFGRIPPREQATMVVEMLRHMDSTRASFRQLTELYLTRDLDALYQFMLDSGIEYGRYDAELLTNRNHAWIPRIIEFAAEKPTFFAVGAGHFGGPQGLLALLRAQGHTLTPVTTK